MEDESRTTNRVPFVEEVTLLTTHKAAGMSVDIGAGGIGIEVPIGLPVGTDVELEILQGHAVTYGTVRWMSPIENGFRLGIQFRTEDWSIIELVLALRSQEA